MSMEIVSRAVGLVIVASLSFAMVLIWQDRAVSKPQPGVPQLRSTIGS